MKTVIVFDHPYTIKASRNEPHFRSYCAAIAQRIIDIANQNRDSVDIIDLHQDNFDPVMHKADLENWRKKLPISEITEDYYRRLASADRIIFIFPIWWEVMPAMTKGFLDKVFSKNHRVDSSPHMLPNNPQIFIFTVSGTPTMLYKLIFGNPISKVLKRGTFNKLGLHKFSWHNFNPEHKSMTKRQKLLDNLNKYLK